MRALIDTNVILDVLTAREPHYEYSAAFLKLFSKLADNVKIVDVTAADVKNALTSDMPDYEDALLAFCGKRQKADYIITRNEKDFRQSPVPVLSPQAFLERD
jgi:predicted nucleic acid-binding protein